jgi:hypothetical protein
MEFKNFDYLVDEVNDHIVYFIKNPKENIIFHSKYDKSSFFDYLSSINCNNAINRSYIVSTHKMKESVFIMVANTRKYQDLRAVQGFAYIKPYSNTDFLQANRVTSTDSTVVDEKTQYMITKTKHILDIADYLLKKYMLRLADAYATQQQEFFNHIDFHLQRNVADPKMRSECLSMSKTLRNGNLNLFLDMSNKFWQLRTYLYISLICSNQKKAGFIIDMIASLSTESQRKFFGFTYQAVALHGIDSAYTYYVKKGFKRSLDGVNYFEDDPDAVSSFFTGEYDGSLFVKRVDPPTQFGVKLTGGKKKKSKSHRRQR